MSNTLTTNPVLDHDLDHLTNDQVLALLEEEYHSFRAAEQQVEEAQNDYDSRLTSLCTVAYKAVIVRKMDLGVVASKLLNKDGKPLSKVTVTTYALIGAGMALPGDNNGKAIERGGQTYRAESVRHIRAVVNEALNRKVKVGKDTVNVGHSVDYIKTAAGTSADRATFITKLKAKTGKQIKAEADKKKAEEAAAAETPLVVGEILSVILEKMDDLDKAVDNPDVDESMAASIVQRFLLRFPNVAESLGLVIPVTE